MNFIRSIACFVGSLWICGVNQGPAFASSPDSLKIKSAEPVQIDFLSGYYQQDGDHSAVTGGEGTEALKDFATTIKIHIPLQPGRSLQLDSRLSYFTSASSDNIDPKTISGASKSDVKVHVQARVNRDLHNGNHSIFYEFGASHEAHFASLNGGAGASGQVLEGRAEWGLSGSYTMDVWAPHYNLSKLYPSDYYGRNDLPSKKRHTLSMGLSYKQSINSSFNFGLSAEWINQFGLLSTPFHRIYFQDTPRIDLERLPHYRLRIPVTARVNGYLADWLIVRTYYRFYWDNFNLKSHTVSVEVPIKLASQFTFYPFYRYHYQYGQQYFAEKGFHTSSQEFYTSDFDQSDLQSHYIGGGLKWMPFFPNRQRSGKRMLFQAVEARGAYYKRSDGFHSWIISGGLSWAILRKEEERRKNQ